MSGPGDPGDVGVENLVHGVRPRFAEPDGLAPDARLLRNELIDIVKWADRNSARSKQLAIGPSELGTECDRRIGYRLAEVLEVNIFVDPWPAIVGTAVHGWLEQAVLVHQGHFRASDWLTETTVQVDQLVMGHSDAYHIPTATVVDYKTAGVDRFKHYVAQGPGAEYITQINLYGRGYRNLGLPVRKVALAFFPRAGRLRDLHMWVERYRPEVADQALERMYRIAYQLIGMGAYLDWPQITAKPGNLCGFCPWYNPKKQGQADGTGCPGK